MKNKREYYRFDSVDWRLRCKETLRQKYSRSAKLAAMAAEIAEAEKIGEPVKFILQLMKDGPRRFKTRRERVPTLFGPNSALGYIETRESTDRKTGHKIKVVLSDWRVGWLSAGSSYTDENNPWMTKGERKAVFKGIGEAILAVELQDTQAKNLAEERRSLEGRGRVMEMYKQEMK